MKWKTTRIKLPPVVPTGLVELKLQWLLNFKLCRSDALSFQTYFEMIEKKEFIERSIGLRTTTRDKPTYLLTYCFLSASSICDDLI